MYQRILVPFDDSPTSNAGLGEAIKLAKLTGASIRLVYALDTLPLAIHASALSGDILGMMAEAGSAALLEGKRHVTASGVPVDTFLSDTYGQRVCEVVAEQAERWKADLIVIGTHGRRGVRRLVLGSDAEQTVRLAKVPVLLVRLTQPEHAARGEVLAGSMASV